MEHYQYKIGLHFKKNQFNKKISKTYLAEFNRSQNKCYGKNN